MSGTQGITDLRARATRSMGWVFLERWGSRLLTLVVFATLSRLIAPADFGLVTLAMIVTALLQVFVDSGFSKSLIQRDHLAPADAPTAFWTAVGTAGVLYVALFFSAPAIAAAFGYPELALVLRVLCLSLPLNALSLTPAALLERSFGFKALSIRQLIGATAGAGAAVALALAGAGVWALVAQALISSTASVIALWSATDWRPSLVFSWVSFRNLAATGLGILGIDLLDGIQANIDKFLIGAFFSTEQLGYYFLAQRLGTILVELLTSVIARVTFTTFSRVQSDKARLNRVLRQLTFAASAIGIPIFALVAALAPQVIPFVFGPRWGPSVPLLWILAPSWAFACVMYFDRSIFLATGHAPTAFFLSLLQNAVGVALVFVLLPFGLVGVAFSRWARIVTWPIRLAYLRRLAAVRVTGYMMQPVRCIAAIAPVIVVIALLQSSPWAHTPFSFWTFAVPAGVIGLAIYAVLLWITAGDSNRGVLRQILHELGSRVVQMRGRMRAARAAQ